MTPAGLQPKDFAGYPPRAREQFERHRCTFPDWSAFGDHRNFGQRQIHVNARNIIAGGQSESGERTLAACW